MAKMSQPDTGPAYVFEDRLPALHVAAAEHQVDQAPGLDDGVGSVALDQEIGCSVNVEIGKHATGRALRGQRPRIKRQRIYDPDEKPVLIW